jgi:hypothetical protein
MNPPLSFLLKLRWKGDPTRYLFPENKSNLAIMTGMDQPQKHRSW